MLHRYIPGQGTVSIGVQDKQAISVGATGPRGPPGPPGPATTIGATGATGPEGPIGLRGERGTQGIQGIQGESGATGPTGPEGPIGPRGMKGDRGDMGVTGPIGLSGPTGPQGEKGDTGETGPTGPEGPTGPQGPPGPATTIGATGATGPIVPSGVYFQDYMSKLVNTRITTNITRIGQAILIVPDTWTYASNAYIQAVMSFKVPILTSTITVEFFVSYKDVRFQPLCKMFMSGSDQLVITGFIPNVSVGDRISLAFNMIVDSGVVEILDYTPVSGVIYHVN